jgi:hypothetical protein
MKSTWAGETRSNKTMPQILPYRFQIMPNGKMAITNIRSQVLMVTQTEVANILRRDDLDAHRRKMYEKALEVFHASAN